MTSRLTLRPLPHFYPMCLADRSDVARRLENSNNIFFIVKVNENKQKQGWYKFYNFIEERLQLFSLQSLPLASPSIFPYSPDQLLSPRPYSEKLIQKSQNDSKVSGVALFIYARSAYTILQCSARGINDFREWLLFFLPRNRLGMQMRASSRRRAICTDWSAITKWQTHA